MTLHDILQRVDPGRGHFRVLPLEHGALLQYVLGTECAKTGKWEEYRGRKWYISPYMTEEEIFRTCLLAVLTFQQHEVYEQFKVDGKLLLDPHPEGERAEDRITWSTLF